MREVKVANVFIFFFFRIVDLRNNTENGNFCLIDAKAGYCFSELFFISIVVVRLQKKYWNIQVSNESTQRDLHSIISDVFVQQLKQLLFSFVFTKWSEDTNWNQKKNKFQVFFFLSSFCFVSWCFFIQMDKMWIKINTCVGHWIQSQEIACKYNF